MRKQGKWSSVSKKNPCRWNSQSVYVEKIEKKALNLLNYATAFVLSPTTQVTAEKENSYLAVGRSIQETYKIAIFARSLVKCSCKGFRYSSICSHMLLFQKKKE